MSGDETVSITVRPDATKGEIKITVGGEIAILTATKARELAAMLCSACLKLVPREAMI